MDFFYFSFTLLAKGPTGKSSSQIRSECGHQMFSQTKFLPDTQIMSCNIKRGEANSDFGFYMYKKWR